MVKKNDTFEDNLNLVLLEKPSLCCNRSVAAFSGTPSTVTPRNALPVVNRNRFTLILTSPAGDKLI